MREELETLRESHARPLATPTARPVLEEAQQTSNRSRNIYGIMMHNGRTS